MVFVRGLSICYIQFSNPSRLCCSLTDTLVHYHHLRCRVYFHLFTFHWTTYGVCVCVCVCVLPSRNGSTSRSFVKKECCTLFTCIKRNAFKYFFVKWYLTVYSDLRDAFLIYLLNGWYSYLLFTESLIPIQIRWAAFLICFCGFLQFVRTNPGTLI